MKLAALLDHFHVTIPLYAHLTDKQIVEEYFYPRDKHGQLKSPTVILTKKTTGEHRQCTPQEILDRVNILAGMLGNSRETVKSVEAARQKLLARIEEAKSHVALQGTIVALQGDDKVNGPG